MSGPYSVESAPESNDAQSMARSGHSMAPEVANWLANHWLDYEFDADRSASEVTKVADVDTLHRGERRPARFPGS